MQGHGEARVTLDQPPAIGGPAVGGVLTKSAASCKFVWVNRPPGGESRTPYWGKLLCSVCQEDYSSKGNQGLLHRQDSRRHCLEHQLLRYELSGQEGGGPALMEEGLHIPSKWKAVNTCFGGSRCAGTLSWSRASHIQEIVVGLLEKDPLTPGQDLFLRCLQNQEFMQAHTRLAKPSAGQGAGYTQNSVDFNPSGKCLVIQLESFWPYLLHHPLLTLPSWTPQLSWVSPLLCPLSRLALWASALLGDRCLNHTRIWLSDLWASW